MVATPETRVTTADALVALRRVAVVTRVTTADALVALNFPSPFVRTTWADGSITVKSTMSLARDEAAVLVAVRGRTANPKLRAWTFSLDGHDFTCCASEHI
jgi:hypothetical protein